MYIQYGIILIMTESTLKQAKIPKKLETSEREITFTCIDETNPPYKGVRGKGTVVISDDISRNIPIAEKIIIKYTGSLDNNMAKFLMDTIKRGDQL